MLYCALSLAFMIGFFLGFILATIHELSVKNPHNKKF